MRLWKYCNLTNIVGEFNLKFKIILFDESFKLINDNSLDRIILSTFGTTWVCKFTFQMQIL